MGLDQEIENELYVRPDSGWHRWIELLLLQIFNELLSYLAVLGNFELDLFLQSDVRRRLHVKFNAECLFFFGEGSPFLIYLKMRVVSCKTIINYGKTLDAHVFFFIFQKVKTLFVALYWSGSCCLTVVASSRVIFIVVVSCILVFQFLSLDEFFYLIKIVQTFTFKVSELGYGLS